MSAIDPMRSTHSAHTSMCMYLHPRGFRGDRPGWFVCNLSCKEVPKHRINNCVRGGCPDYRERDDEVVAGDKGKRIKWDESADQTVSTAPHSLTLREWAQSRADGGETLAAIANRIGCTWGTLQNAIGAKSPSIQKTRKEASGSCAEETQPVPEPKPIMCACWNCDKPLPEGELREDGRHLYCQDCYRKAHAPAEEPGTCQDCGVSEAKHVGEDGVPRCHLNLAYTEPTPPPEPQPAPQSIITCWDCGAKAGVRDCPDGHPRCETCWKDKSWYEYIAAPPAARCQRCEAQVDGRLIMSGVGTVCDPCADAIRQEWEAEQYPAPEPEPEFTCDRCGGPKLSAVDALCEDCERADRVRQGLADLKAQIPQCERDETRRAAQAYLRHIGMGDQEVFALGIWLDAWAARGETE